MLRMCIIVHMLFAKQQISFCKDNLFSRHKIVDKMTSEDHKDTAVFYFETLNNTVNLTLTNLRSYASMDWKVCLSMNCTM